MNRGIAFSPLVLTCVFPYPMSVLPPEVYPAVWVFYLALLLVKLLSVFISAARVRLGNMLCLQGPHTYEHFKICSLEIRFFLG